MASTLRVDPSRLVAAATAEGDVGKSISAMAAGEALGGAAVGMSQLLSGAAILSAASAIDKVSAAINEELTAHSNKLNTAADTYRRVDERLGGRLDQVAERM